MLKRNVRFLKWAGLTGAVVLLTTGCPEDAVDIVVPKATALDFAVAPLGELTTPSGDLTIDGLVLAQFDAAVADAFGRSVAGNDPFYSSTARGDAVDGTDFGPGWNFGGFDRNSTTDPRLPALTENDAVLPATDGFVIGDPATSLTGLADHNPFTEGVFSGLQANTEYVVALARLGTNVNGTLDQEEIMLGDPVASPDELVYVGGAPAGDPTVPIESFPTFVPFQANANPFVLGNFTTDANGEGFFDVVVQGSGNLYDTDSGDPSDAAFDSSLVARNDDTSTTFPRYNYLIIFEGPAVDANDAADNPQAVRVQFAQDFDATSGTPINNAYAPFPSGALTDAELIAAPGGAGRPDSITVELLNAEPLAGGAVWQAWLINRDESPITMAPATASYQRVAIVRELDPVTGEVLSEEDSVLQTVPDVSSFAGQLEADVGGTPQEVKHRLIISDNTEAPGFFTDIVFTQESSAGATTPSGSSAIWFQYTDQNGTPSNFFDDSFGGGTTAFGHIDLSDPSSSTSFSAGDLVQSSGLGGVLDVGGELVAVSVDLRNLPRPPEGFFYEGWLTNPETGATVSMGPLTTLPPDTVSLIDADIDLSLPAVTSTGIRFSNAFMELDGTDAIVTSDGTPVLTTFFLTLEPKLGSANKTVTDLEVGGLPILNIIERLP